MITENQVNKLPLGATVYKVVKIALMLSLLTVPIFIVDSITTWFSMWYTLLIFVGLPLMIWSWLDNISISYIVTQNSIEIKWGILMKKTRTIPFSSIQNIKTESGILPGLCGLSIVSIWSASPSQVRKDGNKPEGLLIVSKEDSSWISDMVLPK